MAHVFNRPIAAVSRSSTMMSRQSRLSGLLAALLARGSAHGAALEISIVDASCQPLADAAAYATSAAGAVEAKGRPNAVVEPADREFVDAAPRKARYKPPLDRLQY